jgi:hypothetical protein
MQRGRGYTIFLLITLWMMACATLPAAARAPAVSVRGGEHGDYSRIVFTVRPGTTYKSLRIGDLLILTFPKAGRVPGLATTPDHVLSVQGGLNQAAIGVAPGMQTHLWQIDRRVIVDVFSPAQNAPAPVLPAGAAE